MTSKLKITFLCVFVISIFLNLSCSSSIRKITLPELEDGKYDSEFPYQNASEELEEITETIRMIHSMAFYTSYSFDREIKLTKNDSRLNNPKDYANSEIAFHQTSAGTATIIYSNNGKVALLTCAHILDFPDTAISYYFDVLGQKTNLISGISIKTRQTNYIPELSGQPEFNTLATDKNLDLTLLGKDIDRVDALRLRPFKYPLGKSEELSWGTFVYLFGYPLNNRMITKGIVSPNDKDNSNFLVDASINKGFSGGVVLAIKDGIPNFELVGIVKSGTGKKEYYLKPATSKRFPLVNNKIPYSDNVYVDENLNLRYGITKVISTESILEFLDNNESQLEDLGYISNYFFNW